MDCLITHDPVGRPTTFLCGSGRRVTPTVCVGCQKRTAVYECDAHVSTRQSDTCDATVCADCSLRIVALDLDVCPQHASAPAIVGPALAAIEARA